jgi:secreted trypsin-like serine protease
VVHWLVSVVVLAALAAECLGPAARHSGRLSSTDRGATGRAAGSGIGATGALVVRPFDSTVVVCTGTLIAPSVVITAAHCLRAHPAKTMEFVLATNVQDAPRAAGIAARRIFLNPEFAIREVGSLHDIGLVELVLPIEGMSAELLMDPAAATLIQPGAGVELVGYGTRDGGGSGQKTSTEATISSVGVDEMKIGGPGEPQNCKGDSGGPAFVIGLDGVRRLAGIVSRSANNATECIDGSIHTRVDAYADWIAATLTVIEEDAKTEGK